MADLSVALGCLYLRIPAEKHLNREFIHANLLELAGGRDAALDATAKSNSNCETGPALFETKS